MIASSSSGSVWVSLFVCVIALVGSCAVGSYKCSSRTSMMGLESSWGPIQGCMVKTKKRGWMPIEALREIDP